MKPFHIAALSALMIMSLASGAVAAPAAGKDQRVTKDILKEEALKREDIHRLMKVDA